MYLPIKWTTHLFIASLEIEGLWLQIFKLSWSAWWLRKFLINLIFLHANVIWYCIRKGQSRNSIFQKVIFVFCVVVVVIAVPFLNCLDLTKNQNFLQNRPNVGPCKERNWFFQKCNLFRAWLLIIGKNSMDLCQNWRKINCSK